MGVKEFIDQDLSGATFERTSMEGAHFRKVRLVDADLRHVNLAGVMVHGAYLEGTTLRGVEMHDVSIEGELENVTINGVDVAPLIDAELNRRMPERALMRPETPEGFRHAWTTLERLWEGTVDRARTLPADRLHESVAGEWSFIQTLRHLGFATAAWVCRGVRGEESPWHPLDLPWDEAPERLRSRTEREARPELEEVLELRRQRQAMVREVMDGLTDDQLASRVSTRGDDWPELDDYPVRDCLRVVLNEEWEHRLYAERDLTALGAAQPAPRSDARPTDNPAPKGQ
jgi:uncharacterized damage-inducible protein DinB